MSESILIKKYKEALLTRIQITMSPLWATQKNQGVISPASSGLSPEVIQIVSNNLREISGYSKTVSLKLGEIFAAIYNVPEFKNVRNKELDMPSGTVVKPRQDKSQHGSKLNQPILLYSNQYFLRDDGSIDNRITSDDDPELASATEVEQYVNDMSDIEINALMFETDFGLSLLQTIIT